jgi:hypothetical protein
MVFNVLAVYLLAGRLWSTRVTCRRLLRSSVILDLGQADYFFLPARRAFFRSRTINKIKPNASSGPYCQALS